MPPFYHIHTQQRSPHADGNCVEFFEPESETENLIGNLPHWRQSSRCYFVTYRLADSIPMHKLDEWQNEQKALAKSNLEGLAENSYFNYLQERMEHWLDQGHGWCIHAKPRVKKIVEENIEFFNGKRYNLDEYVVMPNHEHILVTPLAEFSLSKILHTWKSYSAKAINHLLGHNGQVWQKENFDHLVRSPESLERFRQYIREHPKGVQR